jgi:hypothetical protein
VRKRIQQIATWAVLVLVLIALIEGPHIAWRLRARRELAVVVVDKTVPFPVYREHAFVPWLLHAEKVAKPDGTFLDAAHDYVGYDPIAKVGHELEPAHLAGADALFITDTYGVYVGDYATPGNVAALERSPRIYGGVTDAEAAAIESFSAHGGVVLAEFNTFASPTADSARAALEKTFGVRWTGWVGRYWVDLQDTSEVPRWIGKLYERIHRQPLEAKGSAFVFVREDRDILVLEAGRHLESEVITLERTQEAAELDGLPSSTTYWYWLDVLERVDSDVLYEHVLHLTTDGSAIATAHGIPQRFPALARRRGRATYYFAGDYVDSSVELGNPARAGLLRWRRLLTGATADDRFLWSWYTPVLERLLLSHARKR